MFSLLLFLKKNKNNMTKKIIPNSSILFLNHGQKAEKGTKQIVSPANLRVVIYITLQAPDDIRAN